MPAETPSATSTSDRRDSRLHGLDHLRALAIALVMLFHYRIYYGIPRSLDENGLYAFSAFGWTGVDLFFVLSGYLIADKLLAELDRSGRIRFRTFYLSRALRILPAFFVTLAIYFSFSEVQEGRALQPLWRFLTFTQNIPIDVFANTFSHAWSLCVEEHFYLVLPAILAFLFARHLQGKALYILLGLVASGLLLRYGSWSMLVDPLLGRERVVAALRHLYYPTYARLDGLIVGVGIAALFRYCPDVRDRITRHGNVLLALGLAVLVGCYLWFGHLPMIRALAKPEMTVIGFPLIAIGYGLMVAAALSPSCFLFHLRFRPTAALAGYSYAIYLVHKMSNHWLNTNLGTYLEVGKVQLFLICLVAAVLAGAALHYGIERPFLLLRSRLAERVDHR